jgi:hypothetical protein
MKKVVWVLFAVLLVAAIPHSAFGQARTPTPLTKLTGVYKAAKAVQVNLVSDEMTVKTLFALIESLKLELALAADTVTTRPERDGLAAYERALSASEQASSALAYSKYFDEAVLSGAKETAELKLKLGQYDSTVPLISPETHTMIDKAAEKADRARADAITSLNAAHALYLRKGVVRKVVPR